MGGTQSVQEQQHNHLKDVRVAIADLETQSLCIKDNKNLILESLDQKILVNLNFDTLAYYLIYTATVCKEEYKLQMVLKMKEIIDEFEQGKFESPQDCVKIKKAQKVQQTMIHYKI